MNVIVFASRKGGSGKSTLAAHLAAQVHKATTPGLLIDADPQGSLTLWHKLRGTNEPPIKTAVNSVSAIVAAAKRDGYEWVLIDTPRRSAVFCAYLSINTTFPVFKTASAIPRRTAKRPLSVPVSLSLQRRLR